jgi:phosphoribosylanthranilate isomerase
VREQPHVAIPRVKVCGITSVEDARAAVDAGCDALGFVEHTASPRAVIAERAREVVEAFDGRGVLTVAVVVDRAPDFALRWLDASGARAVQLCGAERARDWRGFPHLVLRRIAVDAHAEGELDAWRDIAAAFVLDHPSAAGGTGREVELELAAHIASLAPCLLAGGLDHQNVAARIAAVQPLGVDASSRLELTAGRKDRERVAAFVRNARAALEELKR